MANLTAAQDRHDLPHRGASEKNAFSEFSFSKTRPFPLNPLSSHNLLYHPHPCPTATGAPYLQGSWTLG